jgi:hypothetical protein
MEIVSFFFERSDDSFVEVIFGVEPRKYPLTDVLDAIRERARLVDAEQAQRSDGANLERAHGRGQRSDRLRVGFPSPGGQDLKRPAIFDELEQQLAQNLGHATRIRDDRDATFRAICR